MDTKVWILGTYIFFGFLLLIFNKQISNLNYKLILFYTNKLRLSEIFIFKVDSHNRNSLIFLTRSFTISFGLLIIGTSSYYLYNL